MDTARAKKNVLIYVLCQIAYTTATTLTTGAVVQTFFEYLGLTEKTSLYTALLQSVQVAAMFACSFFGDRVRKIVRGVTLSLGGISVAGIALFLAAIGFPTGANAKYFFLLLLGCLANIPLGFYNVLMYKLPYVIADIDAWGGYSAAAGIFSGIVGFICTVALTALTSAFPYGTVIPYFFAFGFLMYLASIVLCRMIVPVREVEAPERENKTEPLLKMPAFTRLIPANVIRGIGNGIILLSTTIGIGNGNLTLETSVPLATVTVLATLLGNLVYILLTKIMKVRTLLALSSVIVLVTMPLMTAIPSVAVFYIAYFLAFLFNITLGVCIPVMVYDCVPEDSVGKYTAWRMLLFTFGGAIPGFFVANLIKKIGGTLVLTIGGACLFFCGACYCLLLKKSKKESSHEKA